MSILIKGMEMPTSCADCRVRLAVGCCGNLPHNTRMPNCPLIHVRPHGRLIDADALKLDLTRFYGGEVTAKRLIDEQPTIIPASEEGE